MNTNLVFGQYYHVDSWLHRLDPRTKLLGTLILIVTLFLLDTILSIAVAFVATLLLILSSRIPFSKFLRSLKTMTTLLLITVLFQLFFNRGNLLAEFAFTLTTVNLAVIVGVFVLFFLSKKVIRSHRFFLFLILVVFAFFLQAVLKSGKVIANYSLAIYEEGLFTSLKIVLRIITLLLISSLLTLTTKPADVNMGMEKLAKPLKFIGVKVSILSMMISIALRFIPTLINEAGRILKAQASRGVDFKEGRFMQKVTQIISMLVPMFVISYRRAYELADAMEARGYIPDAERTSISLLKFKASDYLTLIFTLLVFGGIIALKVIDYAV
ncbi:MAG TPA: energy-coupling factor transporter transmembrane protein EcfT [Acholeplasmataceae bacterium]|nr:energy-coupling factor transporter transmembrane protein EcfT [Acholeplasmataceae bacterium]